MRGLPGGKLTLKPHQIKRKLRLDIHLKVNPDCNVKETRTSIRERLEEIMVKNLNFSNFGGVDIIIKGFQSES